MSTETEQHNDSQVGLLEDGKLKGEDPQQIELMDVTEEKTEESEKETSEEKKEGEEKENDAGEEKPSEKKKGSGGGLRSWFKSPKRKSQKETEKGEEKTEEEKGEEDKDGEEKEKTEEDKVVDTEVKEVSEIKEKKEKKEKKPLWFQHKHKKEKLSEGVDGKMTELNGAGGGGGGDSTSDPPPLTYQINLFDRDERHINDTVKIDFEDVLAEPDGSHSIDGLWKVSSRGFQLTKLWVYRLFTLILALPAALLCGAGFALLTLLHVWLVQPLLKVFSVLGAWVNQFVSIVLNASLTPVMVSLGQVWSSVRVNHSGTVHRIHDA